MDSGFENLTPNAQETINTLSWNHHDPNAVHNLNASTAIKHHNEEGARHAAMARHPAASVSDQLTHTKGALAHGQAMMNHMAVRSGTQSTATKVKTPRPKGSG